MPMRLAERRILVVGAGTAHEVTHSPMGIGRGIAVGAAGEGAAVACLDIDLGSAQRTADLIIEAGGSAAPIGADATDPDDASRAIGEAHAALGGLDGIVLNVGIPSKVGMAATSLEEWQRVMTVNVAAHFLICRVSADTLADDASIVFISSTGALRPSTKSPAYTASKNAIHGLCRQVAYELAPRGIRANVICPGRIDTPVARKFSTRDADDWSEIPLGRKGTAADIAHATTFLLSHDAGFITGQILAVDGGATTLAF